LRIVLRLHITPVVALLTTPRVVPLLETPLLLGAQSASFILTLFACRKR
jgi:hypothetical protein